MTENILLVIFLLIIAAVYVAPTFIAFQRRHPNRWLIAVVNIVFGGTLLGWLVALIWALKAFHLGGGGESGVNLFVNDVKKVEIVPPVSPVGASDISSPSLAGEIEKLHSLLQQGIISETEFTGMKARLIGGGAT